MNSEITYTKVGYYYLPNLILTESKYKKYQLGRYGRLRLNYLKNYKKAEYTIMLMNNELHNHIYETETECKKQFEILIKQFAKKENITEKLKSDNQIEWVQKMNNNKNSVEEILLEKYIYI